MSTARPDAPGLEILSLAPGATVQDRGRTGWLRYGVTGGGAMDLPELCAGQLLLGNGAGDAALELPGFGGRFRATGPLTVATSGALMALTVNGAPRPWRQGIALEAGDILEIGAALPGASGGVYGYLHLPGGIDAPVVLGARATHLRARLGLVPEPGMVLRALDPTRRPPLMALEPGPHFGRREIRVMWGPQSHLFSEEVRQAFLAATFTVDPARDRMGVRIRPSSGPLGDAAGLKVASDATLPGDIQITGDGMPAVLLADRGPSGGYPRIAVLATVDLPAMAQMPAGAEFTVTLVTRERAIALLAAERARLAALPRRLRPVTRDPRDIPDLLSYDLVSGVVRGDEDD